MHRVLTGLLALLSIWVAGTAIGQTAQVAFGQMRQDRSLAVEVTADQLAVNQAEGTAVFSGNVLIGQGEMRMQAEQVLVNYADGGGIASLHATGNVVLVSGTDAAEGQEAIYDVENGSIVMTGNVLLTQGDNAVSGQKLTVDLQQGTGVIEGRVKTTFQPGGAQ